MKQQPPPPPSEPSRWPEFMSQQTAAQYLDLTTRTFRRVVDVETVQVTPPTSGRRALRRYRRVDLDAWVQRCSMSGLRSRDGAAA